MLRVAGNALEAGSLRRQQPGPQQQLCPWFAVRKPCMGSMLDARPVVIILWPVHTRVLDQPN